MCVCVCDKGTFHPTAEEQLFKYVNVGVMIYTRVYSIKIYKPQKDVKTGKIEKGLAARSPPPPTTEAGLRYHSNTFTYSKHSLYVILYYINYVEVFLSRFGALIRSRLKFLFNLHIIWSLVHLVKAISHYFEQIANALVHSCN